MNEATKQFPRRERLKSRKRIAGLFKDGRSFIAYPLRVLWSVDPDGEKGAVTIAFAVSKRHFKTAVARNRIKRQMREAYRLQKQDLHTRMETQASGVSVMIQFIAKTAVPYAEIAAGMEKMIRKFPLEN